MYRFILRIRIAESFQDLAFTAHSSAAAIQQAEAQYGHGSFLGCISEQRID